MGKFILYILVILLVIIVPLTAPAIVITFLVKEVHPVFALFYLIYIPCTVKYLVWLAGFKNRKE